MNDRRLVCEGEFFFLLLQSTDAEDIFSSPSIRKTTSE